MEQAKGEVPPVEKKGKGRMVGILVALVLVLSAGAAGAVFAPRLLSKSATPPERHAASAEDGEEADEASAGEEAEEAKADTQDDAEHEEKAAAPGSTRQRASATGGDVVELNPIVVDALATDGSVRHIKVVLAVELAKAMKSDEFKRFVPFAREAAIAYLRTRPFEQLSDAKNFDALRKELAVEIIDAVGKKHARRVLITDYVVQ